MNDGLANAEHETAELIDEINETAFERWYERRRRRLRIRDRGSLSREDTDAGATAWPSALWKCTRRRYYDEHDAPKEGRLPRGRFWVGRQVETELVIPFLDSRLEDDSHYVQGSVWVEIPLEDEGGTVTLRGCTDPCIVDANGNPLLVTEVKTCDPPHRDAPADHHIRQLQAYLGAFRELDQTSEPTGVVLYVDRRDFTLRSFEVPFDPTIWKEVRCQAREHRDIVGSDQLPPANPEYDWECDVCPYRHRCGESTMPFADRPEKGFLPLLETYTRSAVREHLAAHSTVDLTPTLADRFPELAEHATVVPWTCGRCAAAISSFDRTYHPGDRPLCPHCAEAGSIVELTPPTLDEN